MSRFEAFEERIKQSSEEEFNLIGRIKDKLWFISDFKLPANSSGFAERLRQFNLFHLEKGWQFLVFIFWTASERFELMGQMNEPRRAVGDSLQNLQLKIGKFKIQTLNVNMWRGGVFSEESKSLILKLSSTYDSALQFAVASESEVRNQNLEVLNAPFAYRTKKKAKQIYWDFTLKLEVKNCRNLFLV